MSGGWGRGGLLCFGFRFAVAFNGIFVCFVVLFYLSHPSRFRFAPEAEGALRLGSGSEGEVARVIHREYDHPLPKEKGVLSRHKNSRGVSSLIPSVVFTPVQLLVQRVPSDFRHFALSSDHARY